MNAGTNNTSFTTASLTNGQVITCVMTSNAACTSPATATSGGITMVVNPVVTPSVSIALTTGTNPECAGASSTFTATPTNGGATPSYQWLINGLNAGTNSGTFITSSLNDGDIITCVMTSNANCVSGNPATSTAITMSVNTCSSPITLNLKVLIEGFYIGGGQMTGVISPIVCDTIEVSLADASSPHSILYSVKGIINTSGDGSFNFPGVLLGSSFYIVIKHRNTLETWSDVPVALSSPVNNYDFTSAVSRAYGNNLVNLDGHYAILSGDVNKDGIINFNDLSNIETNVQLFLYGYLPQDLTGDSLIESADYSLVENNLLKVVARP